MSSIRSWTASLAATIAIVALAAPSPAYAHTELSSSTPTDGATITTPITEITLKFSGLVKTKFSTIVITGPDAVTYHNGEPTVLDGVVTQPVHPLGSGAYTVAYRVIAADGHPVSGSVAFTADLPPVAAATLPASPATGASSHPQPTPAGDARPSAESTPWVLISGVIAIMAAGSILWRRRILLRRRRPNTEPGTAQGQSDSPL